MKPKLWWLIYFFVVAIPSLVPLSGQSIYHLPQVADGSSGGLQVFTTFVVFNNGTGPGTVTIRLADDAGNALNMNIPGLGNNSIFAFALAPGETRFLQSDGGGNLKVGAATVTVTGDVAVSAIFSIKSDQTGVQGGAAGDLLTEAGIGVAESLTNFAIAVDAQPPFNTGLALQNLSPDATVTLTFTLFDLEGKQEGDPAQLEIAEGGHRAIYVAGPGGIFPSLGNFRGRLLVEATSPVAALTLRQNLANVGPLTTLPVVSTDSTQTSFSLPQVAQGGGLKTQFVIFTLGDTAADVTLTTTNDQGQPLPVNLSNGANGSSFNLQIPANGVLFLETESTGELMAGAARVESDTPIGVSAIFSIVDAQGMIATEAGVGDSPAYTEFTVPVDLTSGFNTGVALFNNSGISSEVTLRFIPEQGTAQQAGTLGPESFTLLPLQHIAKFASELFEGLSDATGQLAIQASSELSAITVRQGPKSLTTMPVGEGIANGGGGGGGEGGKLIHKVVEGVNLTSDATLNQVLPGGFRLFGMLTAPPGFAIGAVSAASLHPSSELDVFLGRIDGTGNYEITVPAGTFDIHIRYEALPAETSPDLYYVEPNIAVNGDKQLNIVVPPVALHSVFGQMTNLGSLPADILRFGFGRDIELHFLSETSLTSGRAGVAEDGSYSLQLSNGAYEVRLSFAQGVPSRVESSTELAEIGQLNVSGNTAANFAVPPLAIVSGLVTLAQPFTFNYGHNLVSALDVASHQQLRAGFLGGSGSAGNIEDDSSYSVTVQQGREYAITAVVSTAEVTGNAGGWGTPLPDTNLQTFNGDAAMNFQYPAFPALRKLSGRVTNQQGEPVEGAPVAVSSTNITGASNTIFNSSVLTDSNGEYSINVFQGVAYRVFFFPPVGQ